MNCRRLRFCFIGNDSKKAMKMFGKKFPEVPFNLYSGGVGGCCTFDLRSSTPYEITDFLVMCGTGYQYELSYENIPNPVHPDEWTIGWLVPEYPPHMEITVGRELERNKLPTMIFSGVSDQWEMSLDNKSRYWFFHGTRNQTLAIQRILLKHNLEIMIGVA